ncbi:MAG: DUF5407 domain-containing protein [Chlamydiales bacterium]|nr:DUF5407 domain-containing protein [Chlamydiia bacterium]MCP5507011.1 DUF5407 domain-containing protein [Chlamydiales bacterium]
MVQQLFEHFDGNNIRSGFAVSTLFHAVDDATLSAKAKLAEIKNRRSAISIGDMFEMQMLMNHLSQISEMSTSVVAAANSAIQSMARNVKG